METIVSMVIRLTLTPLDGDYALNDFDNAVSDLNYNGPMTFLDVARRL